MENVVYFCLFTVVKLRLIHFQFKNEKIPIKKIAFVKQEMKWILVFELKKRGEMLFTFVIFRIIVEFAVTQDKFTEFLSRMLGVNPFFLPRVWKQ